ncbi:hypothetical protein GPECTOR_73g625 [Gonium pectorale]|uniref:Uncharacterized protein n=1 Tax=Gonium pectorale TaxID=33097 RepID=A0A150G2R0_GONPE|nr:hypothetical protein GPECTOR_73g625 [Gonium pectorale]|eukprot:KXZ44104.1 hypothetical protein GPECTOR_73g625 [Gonium pectorale]
MPTYIERVFPRLPPELTELVVDRLDRNEVAGTFRLVNKAAAAQFRGPKHTIIRISQPVPHHAFAARWLARGATRGLTFTQRLQLVSRTAASGVVANLEVAVRATGGGMPTYDAFKAAAASGQLASCQWLLDRGCPTSDQQADGSGLLAAAAGGGHQHVCEWLIGLGLTWQPSGLAEAAHGGHVGLMEWLRQQWMALPIDRALPPWRVAQGIPAAAAHGCDLPTLQRLWQAGGGPHWFGVPPIPSASKEEALAAAAGSPTPDWAAKVEWLEAQGCPRTPAAAEKAAALPDDAGAAARLAWLRGRGYPFKAGAAEAAARSGNAAALLYLLSEAEAEARPDGGAVAAFLWRWDPHPKEWCGRAVDAAAEGGRVGVLRALHEAGRPIHTQRAAEAAARGGHLHVLAWLMEAFGPAAVRPGAELFDAAAESGSVELLAWLRGRGCAWGWWVFRSAARSGCEAALQWLAERGCPMPASGDPYMAACRNGDLATARCLARLGCPWGADGRVFTAALESPAATLPMLHWLLEAGCPVDLAAVRVEYRSNHQPRVGMAPGRLSPAEVLERLKELVAAGLSGRRLTERSVVEYGTY